GWTGAVWFRRRGVRSSGPGLLGRRGPKSTRTHGRLRRRPCEVGLKWVPIEAQSLRPSWGKWSIGTHIHVDAVGDWNPDTDFVWFALKPEKKWFQADADGNNEISATRKNSARRRPSRFKRLVRIAGFSAMTMTPSK